MLNLILRICFWCSRYATISLSLRALFDNYSIFRVSAQELRQAGSGERVLIEKLLSGHSNKLVIFDVGANVGQFSNLLLDALGQQPLEIHAFEPSQLAFDALRASFETCPQVRLNHLALGSSNTRHRYIATKRARRCRLFINGASLAQGLYLHPADH